MANNIEPALARRQHWSAVVAKMSLTIFLSFNRDYSRKHIGRVFEEILVAMAVRENDDNVHTGKAMGAITPTAIEKRLRIPRSNVRHAIPHLLAAGVIYKAGTGYRGDLAYLRARLNAAYFLAACNAICDAADELRATGFVRRKSE